MATAYFTVGRPLATHYDSALETCHKLRLTYDGLDHTMTSTPLSAEVTMNTTAPQTELTQPSPLLAANGQLTQVGWSRQPLLDCNLENARFYALRLLQRFRIKRWDYYGFTTPDHFFSATLADLGYAGQVFIYLIDFTSGEYHEATLTLPFARGIAIPRNSMIGDSTGVVGGFSP